MAPLVVLVVSTVLLRLAGAVGVRPLASWRDSTRIGLAVMFAFTGATHFTSMKHDYAAMVPPPLTGQLWVIYITGLLEIAGAIGLLVPKLARIAGACLCLLLLALFPANVYAALNAVPFRGQPPTDIWLRTLIQVIFISAAWWSTVRREPLPQPQPVP